jgi:hypothetical protein
MTGLELLVHDTPPTILYTERLKDGRIALGTRVQSTAGAWHAGELHVLEPAAYLALAGWLAEPVAEAWLAPVRDRRDGQLRTAQDLYGPGAAGAQRLADDLLREVPRPLLVRALLLLVNSLGPAEHSRLVGQINATPPGPEEEELRRRLAEQREGFAYALAGAALLDAIEAGLDDDG